MGKGAGVGGGGRKGCASQREGLRPLTAWFGPNLHKIYPKVITLQKTVKLGNYGHLRTSPRPTVVSPRPKHWIKISRNVQNKTDRLTTS